MIRPFKINIESAQFADLRERVTNSRLAPDLNMAGWEMGTPKCALRDVLKYWTEVYDWSRKEEELDSFPQYVWETGGMRIHFSEQFRCRGPLACPDD